MRNKLNRKNFWRDLKMKIDTTNTLTESQINDWKKQYKKIYKSIVGEEVIIWRKLKRSEYIDIMTNSSFKDDDSNKSPYLRQDAIVKMCCLYPSNMDEIIEENVHYLHIFLMK